MVFFCGLPGVLKLLLLLSEVGLDMAVVVVERLLKGEDDEAGIVVGTVQLQVMSSSLLLLPLFKPSVSLTTVTSPGAAPATTALSHLTPLFFRTWEEGPGARRLGLPWWPRLEDADAPFSEDAWASNRVIGLDGDEVVTMAPATGLLFLEGTDFTLT